MDMEKLGPGGVLLWKKQEFHKVEPKVWILGV